MQGNRNDKAGGVTCCICGCELPNRYSVAGACEKGGCDSVFCSLHWRRSNHLCREHGYREQESRSSVPDSQPAPERESPMNTNAGDGKRVDPKKVKQALAAGLDLVKRMGIGATELMKKLKKDKSPEAMLKTVEDSLAANQQRREGVAARVEKTHAQIVAKKKDYSAAGPARKRILEHELASLVAQYKAGERELTVLLENERVLSQVKGRMMEVASYGMAGVSEAQIDILIDDVDEAVEKAEGRIDASRDLEKAGRRRERESDRDSLFDELDRFGESEGDSSLSKELASFDEPEPAPKSGKKPLRENEE